MENSDVEVKLLLLSAVAVALWSPQGEWAQSSLAWVWHTWAHRVSGHSRLWHMWAHRVAGHSSLASLGTHGHTGWVGKAALPGSGTHGHTGFYLLHHQQSQTLQTLLCCEAGR